ncbi:MAG: hypothetical protein JJ863_38520 [Deltaproteobacteria bacterium]|nr:hypothetical protein [Deltaproteobacteria bacterium]
MTLLTAMRVLSRVEEGDRQEAGRVLIPALEGIARSLRPGAPPWKQEEAVQDALWRLLRSFETSPLRTDHEGGAHQYAKRAVRSAYQHIERNREGGELPEQIAAEPPTEDHIGLLEDAERHATRVLEASIVRWPRSETVLRESFAEMVDLASTDQQAGDLLDPALDEGARIKARDALFKRHERSRKKLLEMIGFLQQAGEMDEQAAHLARAYIGWLKRRKTDG